MPRDQIEVLRVPAWEHLDWLYHGFSTRLGGVTQVYRPERQPGDPGDLNLGFTASDSPDTVAANRNAFVQSVTAAESGPVPALVTVQQVHSAITHPLTREPDTANLQGDGMMTGEPGLLLGIQTADCIPVLVADTRLRTVAAFHAGWRGTVRRIVEQGVGRMRLEFGSQPEDMVAAIGPGIGACCYAVGEEVRGEFESQFRYAAELFSEAYDSDPIREKYPMLFLTARAPGHSPIGPALHLDLIEANRRQLLDAGLGESAIRSVSECTSCRTDRYFSHRAEHGFTGRMLSVIGLR